MTAFRTLEGKVAVVTGGGRGIGRAIVEKLAASGARVAINDLDPGPAEEAAVAATSLGSEAVVVAGDVAAADFGERLIGTAVERFGGVDILVNNAGYIWNTAIQNNTDDQWYAMIDVHATAPFRILRAAAEHFRTVAKDPSAPKHTRKVVNVSSVSAVYGAATQISYAAAKGAVIAMTNTLAREWGRYNVTVNCVAFGYIDTRLTQRLDDGVAAIEVAGRQHKVGLPPALVEKAIADTPLGRAGRPEDAAGAVYLLCLPESDFISGQTVVCAGGRIG